MVQNFISIYQSRKILYELKRVDENRYLILACSILTGIIYNIIKEQNDIANKE